MNCKNWNMSKKMGVSGTDVVPLNKLDQLLVMDCVCLFC